MSLCVIIANVLHLLSDDIVAQWGKYKAIVSLFALLFSIWKTVGRHIFQTRTLAVMPCAWITLSCSEVERLLHNYVTRLTLFWSCVGWYPFTPFDTHILDLVLHEYRVSLLLVSEQQPPAGTVKVINVLLIETSVGTALAQTLLAIPEVAISSDWSLQQWMLLNNATSQLLIEEIKEYVHSWTHTLCKDIPVPAIWVCEWIIEHG